MTVCRRFVIIWQDSLIVGRRLRSIFETQAKNVVRSTAARQVKCSSAIHKLFTETKQTSTYSPGFLHEFLYMKYSSLFSCHYPERKEHRWIPNTFDLM